MVPLFIASYMPLSFSEIKELTAVDSDKKSFVPSEELPSITIHSYSREDGESFILFFSFFEAANR